MKKIILSLFVAGAIAFGLQSCKDDECTASSCPSGQECVNGECKTVETCDACGTYNGKVDSNNDSLRIEVGGGIGLDTFDMENLPATAIVSEGSASGKLNLKVNLDLEISGTPVTVPVVLVDVNYNASTNALSLTNREIEVKIEQFSITVYVKIESLTGTVDGTNADVTIEIDDWDSATSDNIEGTIHFAGSK